MEKFVLEGWGNLSEGAKRAVLVRQEEERANRPTREISELTNQVRKHRDEFMQWLNENKKNSDPLEESIAGN